MSQISHPNLGSPCAMVTPYAELVVVGSRSSDISTYSNITIDYQHHEVHAGDHFFLRNYSIIGSGIGSSLWFSIITQNSPEWMHFFYTINGTAVTISKLYENSTLSGGILVSPINSNRNCANTSILNVRSQPVVSGAVGIQTSGTLISASSFGLATGQGNAINRFGGTTSREQEVVLKSGTTYLIEITSATTDNIISYDAQWYEHIDKEKQF